MISMWGKTQVGKEDKKWEGIDILDRVARRSLIEKVPTVLKKVRERVVAVSERRTFRTEDITSTKAKGRSMAGIFEVQCQCPWTGAR